LYDGVPIGTEAGDTEETWEGSKTKIADVSDSRKGLIPMLNE
jgi:hypothetical protein